MFSLRHHSVIHQFCRINNQDIDAIFTFVACLEQKGQHQQTNQWTNEQHPQEGTVHHALRPFSFRQ